VITYQKYGSDSFRTGENGKLREEKRGFERGKELGATEDEKTPTTSWGGN
jgi:hypothetical protein